MAGLRGRGKRKIQSLGGLHEGKTTRWGYTPPGVPGSSVAPREGGHHVAREPAQLLLELCRREALGPVDHALVQTRIPALDLANGLDHLGGPSHEPRLLLHALAQGRHARGRARGAPRAALLVRVAHESERSEPLVALVVRGLEAADRLLARVGEVEAHAPAEVLAEGLGPPVTGARVVVGARDLVEHLLAVQGHHR